MVVLAELLVFAVRAIGLLLLVRFILRAFQPQATRRPARAAAPRPQPPSPDLVRDRICNTFLPRERALRAMVGGRQEHFCSAACRDRALADAARAS
jgi:hypothetical protein